VNDVFGATFDPKEYRRLANIVFFPEVDSTNAVGRGLIDHAMREEVELAPTVIAAACQTRGRGRRDRPWASPGGGVYATFVFHVPEGARISHLPLAAAVWVAEASSAAGVEVRLKWPNDVLCGSRKLAGVLTEAKTRGDETIVAVGVGVNALGSAERFDGRATTLEAEGASPVSAAGFFRELCLACDRYLRAPGKAGIVEAWLERSRHAPGDEIRVIVENGTERELAGEFAGLTPDGLLRVRIAGAEVVVASGEVQTW
jgi:BirA family biotin operon repressor/biotin-[acetyl-CoA-carboxylase] ligase